MAKILVIDDELESREMVKQALEGDHEVFMVENWVHVADYIFKYDIDLILMDVNMPGLKGDKLTEILMRQSKTSKPLKIVLFSALDEAELKEKVKEVNAKGYILKTFDKNLLHLRVSRFLRD